MGGQVRSVSPFEFDCTIFTPNRTKTAGRIFERNALRAERVARAEDGKGSSRPSWLRGDPLRWRGEVSVRDQRGRARVTEPLSAGDLQRSGHSGSRGRPCGGEAWPQETAIR